MRCPFSLAKALGAVAVLALVAGVGLAIVRDDPHGFSFAAAPPGSWWDASYAFRAQLTVTAGPNSPLNGYSGYSVSFVVDTAALVGAGKMRADCDDLRLTFWSGAAWLELDRDIYACNSTQTEIWFRSQADIAASSADDNYYVYYSNPAAGAGPSDRANVYLHYNDWSTDRLSEYAIGRQDNWHGSGTYTGFTWDSVNERVDFNTGNNFTGGLLLAGFGERDVYIEQTVAYTSCYPNNVTQGPMGRYSGDGTSSNNWYAFVQANSTGCTTGAYTNPAIQKDNRSNSGICGSGTGTPWALDGATHRQGFALWGVNPTNLKGWLDKTARKPPEAPDLSCTDAAVGDHENAGDVAWMQAQSQGWFDDFLVRRYTEPEPSTAVGGEEQFPTPTPTPTATPTPTPTPTPSATPTTTEESPSALPPTGSEPPTDGPGSLIWLVATGALVVAAGGLYVVRMRRG